MPDRLIVVPEDTAKPLIDALAGAKASINIRMFLFTDPDMYIMARPPHNLKQAKLSEGVGGLRIMRDVGARVHRLKHLKLHGKLLIADEERAFIDSINLAPGSFDERRELAIETHSPEVIERLKQVTRRDGENSEALGLSDEGVLADLARDHQGRAGAKQLALKSGNGRKK